MRKDRDWRLALADDTEIVVTQSSRHAVEYAIMLIVRRNGADHTVRTFDNAHDSQEHHEHRYIGADKQPPIITHGPVNQAMNAALVKLNERWADMVAEWEQTR